MIAGIGGRLVLASHNKGKLAEIAALLAPFAIEARPASDFHLPVPDETEETFEGNALLKARAATAATGLPALSDDSGLAVAALQGAPGVHTADWAETPDGRDWMFAMQKVEDKLQALGEGASRAATFHCVLALAFPDGRSETFHGTAAGHLVWPPRGRIGFGYDPVFVPAGDSRTFAEMEPLEKQRQSHRTAAFRQFVAALARP